MKLEVKLISVLKDQYIFIFSYSQSTPRSIPIKRGCDAKTLVEDNELFIFDHDVEPILSVLCGKTLESARMEVLEEEELRVMRE